MSTSSFVEEVCLLLLDPTINVDALKPPLSAHLKCGQLALLSHGIDGLSATLSNWATSGNVKISSGIAWPRVGKVAKECQLSPLLSSPRFSINVNRRDVASSLRCGISTS